MDDRLGAILAAWDRWRAAMAAKDTADRAVKAMGAYALSEEDRMRMYNERTTARNAALAEEYEARAALEGAIEAAR
jgi:hypothetical protein